MILRGLWETGYVNTCETRVNMTFSCCWCISFHPEQYTQSINVPLSDPTSGPRSTILFLVAHEQTNKQTRRSMCA